MTDEELKSVNTVIDMHLTAWRKAYAETGDIGLALQLANGFVSAIIHKPDEIDRMDGLDMTTYEVEGFKV